MVTSFFSALAGSSVPVDSIFFVHTLETLGTWQGSKQWFRILFTNKRCAMWIETVVLEAQSRFFIATNVLNAVSVYQGTSIDYTFV